MAKQARHFITKEGLKKLMDELDYLKTTKRAEIAERLKEAISYGDLKENSEYEAAKNEQALVESRIREIEDEIASAEVLTEKTRRTDHVEIGSTVTIEHLAEKEHIQFTLVGTTEVDPVNYKFSNESPVGEAVLGKNVGEIVIVKAPAGDVEYKILKIE